MDDTLIIEPRFNGPRLSGNGGYVGGVMAGKFARRSAATARSRSRCAHRFRSIAACRSCARAMRCCCATATR